MTNQLPQLKEALETQWLTEVHSQILQQSLKDLDGALRHFFRRIKKKLKSGFPRFKCRGVKDSFRFPQGVKCLHGKVYLPKIGWVSYYNSRPIEGDIKQAVVKRHGDRWFVHIVCSIGIEIPSKNPPYENVLGIDLGIKQLAVFSNGDVIENLHFLKVDLKRLAKTQRSLSRKKRGSKNRKKSAKRVGKAHRRIANKRKDHLHKISTQIIESQDVIVVETLNIQGMIRNRCLSQAIADVSWSMLLRFLKYKADWYGKKYIEIPRFTPTSKTCSSCKSQQKMPLSVRIYECKSCGLRLDRDLNAAINIKAAGLAVLACGEQDTGPLNEARIPGF